MAVRLLAKVPSSPKELGLTFFVVWVIPIDEGRLVKDNIMGFVKGPPGISYDGIENV